jgi:hypothetical protein
MSSIPIKAMVPCGPKSIDVLSVVRLAGESANIITPRKLPSSASTRRVTLIVTWCETRPITGLPMKIP